MNALSMLAAPIPADESQRIVALRRLGIVGTTGHARFDQITRTLALALKVPTAAISLIDTADQWLLSCHGPGTQSVPREITFCGHAIVQPEVFVVEDARLDPRFAQNPLVTGPANIRFYAGCRLVSLDGYALGALCVIDDKPRIFDADAEQLLRGFATWAQTELNAHARERARLEAAGKRLLAPAVHQIRGNLTNIVGFADILINQNCPPEQNRELLGIIYGQATQLSSLVSELVDLFHVETTAGQDFKRTLQPLAPIIEDAIAAANHAADTDGQIKFTADAGLPAILVDRNQLQQALFQLLGHISAFPGDNPIDISLGRAAERGYVALTIDYPAMSLTPTEIDRMFEPFFRLNRRETNHRDGLGFALTKEIVELHGGRVVFNEDETAHKMRLSLLLPAP
jgi:signal transduction histidine kinase